MFWLKLVQQFLPGLLAQLSPLFGTFQYQLGRLVERPFCQRGQPAQRLALWAAVERLISQLLARRLRPALARSGPKRCQPGKEAIEECRVVTGGDQWLNLDPQQCLPPSVTLGAYLQFRHQALGP